MTDHPSPSHVHRLPPGSYAEERLPSVTVPVLATWGAHDRFVRPTNAERRHALLPHGELTVFADAGHFSHEDADSGRLDRFLAFVDSHQTSDDQTTLRSDR